MKKGDKTCGIGGVLVGRQDTSVFKRSKVVRFRENAKAIRVYKRGVVVDKSRGREVKKSRSNRVGLYRKGEAGLFVGGKSGFFGAEGRAKEISVSNRFEKAKSGVTGKGVSFRGAQGPVKDYWKELVDDRVQLEGWLPSCIDGQMGAAFSRFQGGRKMVLLYGAPFWSIPITMDIFKNNEGIDRLLEVMRDILRKSH